MKIIDDGLNQEYMHALEGAADQLFEEENKGNAIKTWRAMYKPEDQRTYDAQSNSLWTGRNDISKRFTPSLFRELLYESQIRSAISFGVLVSDAGYKNLDSTEFNSTRDRRPFVALTEKRSIIIGSQADQEGIRVVRMKLAPIGLKQEEPIQSEGDTGFLQIGDTNPLDHIDLLLLDEKLPQRNTGLFQLYDDSPLVSLAVLESDELIDPIELERYLALMLAQIDQSVFEK
jgi:hypothetical protein